MSTWKSWFGDETRDGMGGDDGIVLVAVMIIIWQEVTSRLVSRLIRRDSTSIRNDLQLVPASPFVAA